jgi:hypothetical protein
VDVPPAHGKGHDFNVFSSVYPAELTQTGTVECTEETPGLVTHLWVYLLVVLHAALCLVVPILAMFWIKNAPWPKTKGKGPYRT